MQIYLPKAKPASFGKTSEQHLDSDSLTRTEKKFIKSAIISAIALCILAFSRLLIDWFNATGFFGTNLSTLVSIKATLDVAAPALSIFLVYFLTVVISEWKFLASLTSAILCTAIPTFFSLAFWNTGWPAATIFLLSGIVLWMIADKRPSFIILAAFSVYIAGLYQPKAWLASMLFMGLFALQAGARLRKNELAPYHLIAALCIPVLIGFTLNSIGTNTDLFLWAQQISIQPFQVASSSSWNVTALGFLLAIYVWNSLRTRGSEFGGKIGGMLCVFGVSAAAMLFAGEIAFALCLTQLTTWILCSLSAKILFARSPTIYNRPQ